MQFSNIDAVVEWYFNSSARGDNMAGIVSTGVHGKRVEKTILGAVAEWSCSGLQLRVRRFDSDPRLQYG